MSLPLSISHCACVCLHTHRFLPPAFQGVSATFDTVGYRSFLKHFLPIWPLGPHALASQSLSWVPPPPPEGALWHSALGPDPLGNLIWFWDLILSLQPGLLPSPQTLLLPPSDVPRPKLRSWFHLPRPCFQPRASLNQWHVLVSLPKPQQLCPILLCLIPHSPSARLLALPPKNRLFPLVCRRARPCLLPPPLHPPVSLPRLLLPGNQLRPWPSTGHGPLITLWIRCKVPRWPLCPLWSGPCLPGGALCYHPSGLCTCWYFHSGGPMPGSPSGGRSWLPCHLLQEAFLDLSLRELRALIPLHSLSA